jgi:signal transduction histidine kinase
MQEHGGVIEAVSRPAGGTLFHLEFPWSKAGARVMAAARKPVNA